VTGSAAKRRDRLVEVFNEASGCTRCALGDSRTQVVFGAGNADADLMLVGEAPGADEDLQGLPFVGRSGSLLTRLLADAGLPREEVFITNTLKCRPPANRDPLASEVETCHPWLQEQIRLVEPRYIASLGNFATKLLSGDPTGITKVHGRPRPRVFGDREVLLYPLFHPAAALRSTRVADLLREDILRLAGLVRGQDVDLSRSGPEVATEP